MKYRADIDGLRALAVIAVIMYHAHLGFPGGYAGVDVFFVISGFLITSILVKALKSGTFSYLDFWERRARRLVPVLFVTTLVTAFVAYHVLLPRHLVDLGGSLIAQPLLMANIYFWRVVQGGYFGDPPEIRPLLHTWSLGVEEQFYIFFPLLLLFCFRTSRRRFSAPTVLLMLGVMSFALGVYLTPIKGVAAFFNLPTRAWELLMGGMLVFAPSVPQRYRESLSWVGLLLVLYSFFFYDKGTPFPGTAALLPCLGTAFLIGTNEGHRLTRIGAVLSRPVFVSIGLASYSLYLWHWPLFAFAEYAGLMTSLESKLGAIALSFGAGYLSWRYIETPFRGHRWLSTRRSVALLFLSYLLTCGSIGLWFRINDGFPSNWEANSVRVAQPDADRAFIYEHEPGKGSFGRPIGMKSAGDRVDFVLWGDSHAMAVATVLDALGTEFGLQGLQITASAPRGTLGIRQGQVVTDEIRNQREIWQKEIVKAAVVSKASVVFICGFWSVYEQDGLREDLRAVVEELEMKGVQVVVVLDNPQIFGGRTPYRCEAIAARWPVLASLLPSTALVSAAEHKKENVSFDQFSRSLGCETVELAPAIYAWGGLVRDGKGLYHDDDHLSDYGALQLRGLFVPFFQGMASSD